MWFQKQARLMVREMPCLTESKKYYKIWKYVSICLRLFNIIYQVPKPRFKEFVGSPDAW